MHRKTQLLILLLIALLTLAAVPLVLAQDDDPQQPQPGTPITADDVNDVAQQLYCPVCENIPLDVCGTQACADWREEIHVMLEQGRSEEEIKTYFSDRYGKRVLANPGAAGIDAIVWALPPLAIVLGGVFLALTLRRMAPETLETAMAPDAALSYAGLDPAYVSRLEEELQEFIAG